MVIVIIEDEQMVADDLQDNLQKFLLEPANIIKLYTVKSSIQWLKSNPAPDLIFSDIQLGDGLSFEVFNAVPMMVPIIFCTAYDQYALEAFQLNGINYILKPYAPEILESALKKFFQFKQMFTEPTNYDAVLELLTNRAGKSKTSSILVYYKDKIMPVKLEKIALFYLENEIIHLLTFDGKVYYPNKTLEELEKIGGNTFFRASRQVLVCRKAITDVSTFFSRRLSLNLSIDFQERITVSRNRSAAFLEWLTSE